MTLIEIKTLLQITDTSKDTLIETLIPMVEDYVKQYTNNFADDVYPATVKLCISQLVNYHLTNHDLSIIQERMGGVSYTYSDKYPVSVTATLNKYRKCRW